MSASQQNFTILGVFTTTIGYLMMRFLTLDNGLQKPSGDGPRSAHQKFAFTL
jgi:hypothetical protein